MKFYTRYFSVVLIVCVNTFIFSQNFYNNRTDVVEMFYENSDNENGQLLENNVNQKIKSFIIQNIEDTLKIKIGHHDVIDIKELYSKWSDNKYYTIRKIKIDYDKLKKLESKQINADKISSETNILEKNVELISLFIHNNKVDFRNADDIKYYSDRIYDYSNEIELNNNLDTYYTRGLAYYFQRKYQHAINDFTTIMALSPKYLSRPDIYFFRGSTYYYKKRYKDAIRDYTKVLQINPNYKRAYRNRALSKKQIGDLKGYAEDRNMYIKLGGTLVI